MTQPQRRQTRTTGFTLLEMLVVSGMILLLAGLLIAAGAELRKQALIRETRSRINALEAAVEHHYSTHRVYPGSLADLSGEISYQDAWGNDIKYTQPGSNNTDFADIYSYGPDGADDAGGDDDINNWSRL